MTGAVFRPGGLVAGGGIIAVIVFVINMFMGGDVDISQLPATDARSATRARNYPLKPKRPTRNVPSLLKSFLPKQKTFGTISFNSREAITQNLSWYYFVALYSPAVVMQAPASGPFLLPRR